MVVFFSFSNEVIRILSQPLQQKHFQKKKATVNRRMAEWSPTEHEDPLQFNQLFIGFLRIYVK